MLRKWNKRPLMKVLTDMTDIQTEGSNFRKPLRIWPGLVAAGLMLIVFFGAPIILPEVGGAGLLGGIACGLAVMVWWLFFSRAPWPERLGAIALMVVAVLVTLRFVHDSIANGMMGMLLPIYAIPAMSLALVAAAMASLRLSTGARRAIITGAIILACGGFTMIRTGGMTGDAQSDFHWRWTESPEERLIAQADNEKDPEPPPAAPTPSEPLANEAGEQPTAPPMPTPEAEKAPEKRADWSGFRGPKRNGVVPGLRIATDWSKTGPVELWRRPVGPGWSSFAVHGDLIFTQEQRGDDEVVSCYNLTTGAPVWRHRDAARFWESNGGAGPRSTPTYSKGRVYTLGATGILNALDARSGKVVWSRNAATDTQTKIPGWGFASSPLVIDDTVIVATAGELAAYDIATGKSRWFGPDGGSGYSSPHLATIDGVAQVLLLNGEGAISVAPADGKLLWKHAWPGDSIVQPAVLSGGDVLIGSGSGIGNIEVGIRRVAVRHSTDGWSVEDRWTSKGLKPYFNDFIVHKDLAFGFDGSILACVDLKDGQRKWKGGRYGHGQMIALPDQDLLLVLSEEGELALVAAASDRFTELARVPGIEGKTWNHPVIVGDLLLVRNGEQMAAFRLSLQK